MGIFKKINIKIIILFISRYFYKTNNVWIFSDRINKASDNAEAMYDYVVANRFEEKCYFVISKKSNDYERLKEKGFRLIKYGSLKHYIYLYNANYFLTSHINEEILFPWGVKKSIFGTPIYKLVFLQHGILRSDLSHWFNNKNINLLITSTQEEYNSIINNSNYNIKAKNIAITGLARYDLLEKYSGKYVLIFPTWRSYLENDVNAIESTFAQNWLDIVEILNDYTNIKIVLHSSLQIMETDFNKLAKEKNKHIEFIKYNEVRSFTELINQASCLITDYSSISFDFLYLKKPVLYYLFEESEKHFTNLATDYEINNRLGYVVKSKLELKDKIDEISNNCFILENEKIKNIDNYFQFNDTCTRERIYKAIKKGNK